MKNEEKAIEISESNGVWYSNGEGSGSWSDDECYKSALEAMQWKDKQFKELIESELKQWKGDSCEAKYRIEMLKELIEKLNG
jgi:hypothetical protein